jgi:hypothetical protein
MDNGLTPTGRDPSVTAFLHRLEAAGYLCNINNDCEGAVWRVVDKEGRAYFVAGKDDYQCVLRLTAILGDEHPKSKAN